MLLLKLQYYLLLARGIHGDAGNRSLIV